MKWLAYLTILSASFAAAGNLLSPEAIAKPFCGPAQETLGYHLGQHRQHPVFEGTAETGQRIIVIARAEGDAPFTELYSDPEQGLNMLCIRYAGRQWTTINERSVLPELPDGGQKAKDAECLTITAMKDQLRKLDSAGQIIVRHGTLNARRGNLYLSLDRAGNWSLINAYKDSGPTMACEIRSGTRGRLFPLHGNSSSPPVGNDSA